MSNIQHTDISLGEMKNNIERGIYCIPKFQRQFVWKSPDIESLGDSLLRGYPISSILLMPANGSLNIGATNLVVKSNDSKESSYYVLDGQQRITAIAHLFTNSINQNRQYFFDLLAILCETYPNANLQSTGFLQKCKRKKLSENYCCSFDHPKNPSTKKDGGRFISPKQVIEGHFGSIVLEFLDNLIGEKNSNFYQYLNYLTSLLGRLEKYGIAQTIIEQNAELGVVCRVFEKVNSSGRKLTTFDLINSKSFLSDRDKDGLSQFLSQELNNEKRSYQEKSAIEFFFEYDKKEQYANLGRITRIIFIADLLENNSFPVISNPSMLLKKPEFWFDKWREYKSVLIKALCKIYEIGLQDFTPITYLEYILAIICANPNCIDNVYFMNIVKKFALKLGVENSSFTKTNLDIVCQFYQYSIEVLKIVSLNNYHELKHPSTQTIISKNSLREAKQRNFRFEAVFYIMTKEKHDWKFTHDIAKNELSNEDGVERHHIFAKSIISTDKQDITSSIANIIPLSKIINKSDMKDKDIITCLSDLKKKYGEEEARKICDINLMPNEILNISSIDKIDKNIFLNQRLELICNYINSYFKD